MILRILEPLWKSFYLKDIYCRFAEGSKRYALLYLFVIITLFLLPTGYQLTTGINEYIDTDLQVYIDQFPTVEIAGGSLSIDKDSPHYIKEKDSDENIIIFDMDGKLGSIVDVDTHVLVTPTKVFVKKNDYEVRTYQIPQDEDFEFGFDKHDVRSWSMWGKLIPLVLIPVMLAGILLYRILQVLFFALLGNFFIPKQRKGELTYEMLFKLTIAAITPSLVIHFVQSTLSVNIPLWWFIGTVMTLMYLRFGVKSVLVEQELIEAEEDKEEELSEEIKD